MAKFGQLLQELRKLKSLSQMELADKLGMKQSKISYLEKSKDIPKEETLEKITEFFNIPVSYFFEKSDEKVEKAKDYLRRLADQLPEKLVGERASLIAHSLKYLPPSEKSKIHQELIREMWKRERGPTEGEEG